MPPSLDRRNAQVDAVDANAVHHAGPEGRQRLVVAVEKGREVGSRRRGQVARQRIADVSSRRSPRRCTKSRNGQDRGSPSAGPAPRCRAPAGSCAAPRLRADRSPPTRRDRKAVSWRSSTAGAFRKHRGVELDEAVPGSGHRTGEQRLERPVPGPPGCVTAGGTLDDALAFAEEALAVQVHGMREDVGLLPAPSDVESRDCDAFTLPSPNSANCKPAPRRTPCAGRVTHRIASLTEPALATRLVSLPSYGKAVPTNRVHFLLNLRHRHGGELRRGQPVRGFQELLPRAPTKRLSNHGLDRTGCKQPLASRLFRQIVRQFDGDPHH